MSLDEAIAFRNPRDLRAVGRPLRRAEFLHIDLRHGRGIVHGGHELHVGRRNLLLDESGNRRLVKGQAASALRADHRPEIEGNALGALRQRAASCQADDAGGEDQSFHSIRLPSPKVYLGVFEGERKQRSRGSREWQSAGQQLASLGVVVAGLIVLAFVVGAL